MLKYQLHKLSKGGKEAKSVYLEDILTSDIFGIMNYVPYEDLLKPFLEKVKSTNKFFELSIPSDAPKYFHFWKSYLWPDDLPYLKRQSIEPDVVIEWDDLLIFIEAKFVSPTDPEELLREYLVACYKAQEKKDFYLLLIDKNLSVPVVNEPASGNKVSIKEYLIHRFKQLALSDKYGSSRINSAFIWSNWQTVYKLIDWRLDYFNRMDESINYPIHRIMTDLLVLMEKKNLRPFQELDLKTLSERHINLPSFGDMGLIITDLVVTLSNKQVNLASLGDVGQTISDPVPTLSEKDIDLVTILNLANIH